MRRKVCPELVPGTTTLCGDNTFCGPVCEKRARHASYMQERYKTIRAKWIQAKGGKCELCGETSNLEFDHKDRSQKLFAVSSWWSIKKESVEAELEKCQLLCKDCHLKKTVSETIGPREHGTIVKYQKEHCRCLPCRQTWESYRREWRLRKGRTKSSRGPYKARVL